LNRRAFRALGPPSTRVEALPSTRVDLPSTRVEACPTRLRALGDIGDARLVRDRRGEERLEGGGLDVLCDGIHGHDCECLRGGRVTRRTYDARTFYRLSNLVL